MVKPQFSSVEEIIAHINDTDFAQKDYFELLISQSLTLRGSPVPMDAAMAIVLDKILAKRYEPDGFVQCETGRLYRYKLMK